MECDLTAAAADPELPEVTQLLDSDNLPQHDTRERT